MNRTLHLSRPGREPASESSDSGEPRPIGGEIRGLRNARRLTLTDLADASGLSIGYLSLLERDRATPSIKALHAVSRALGVTISWFPRGMKCRRRSAISSCAAQRRRRLDYSAGLVDELLSPNLSGALELLSCRFPPGASSGEETYTHAGEEAGVVIRGRLELWVSGRSVLLEARRQLRISEHLVHLYRNPGPDETEVN
jgi:transcriptional regulator with XRE-family HTH domain